MIIKIYIIRNQKVSQKKKKVKVNLKKKNFLNIFMSSAAFSLMRTKRRGTVDNY